MEVLLPFAFLAGVVTVLSPCILPLLPVILAGSLSGGDKSRLRPLGIIVGFIVMFTLITLTLSVLMQALSLHPDTLRILSGFLIGGFGLVLLVPPLKQGFMTLASRILSKKPKQSGLPLGTAAGSAAKRGGFWSGAVLGSSLGIAWTPCAGPIMATVVTLSITQQHTIQSVLLTMAYAVGTAIPLFLVMLGGRGLLSKLKVNGTVATLVQQIFGALLILSSIALLTGLDRALQTWVVETFPGYAQVLEGVDANDQVLERLGELY